MVDLSRRKFCRSIGKGALTLAGVLATPCSTALELVVESDVVRKKIVYDDDYYAKISNPDYPAKGDVWATEEQKKLLDSCHDKLSRARRYIGFSRFNYADMETILKVAETGRKTGRIDNNKAEKLEPFTKNEKGFMEDLFRFDAKEYGFYGEKVITDYNHKIDPDTLIHVPGSGHCLIDSQPRKVYEKIKTEAAQYRNQNGNQVKIMLTSGIRNIPKQAHLFLGKALRVDYNLSAASRSLAPPGYSWHGAGDFDVGKPDAGMMNFTPEFTETDQYRALKDLGYLKLIRYPTNNKEGVRFEPWHIMVGHSIRDFQKNIGNIAKTSFMPDYKGVEKILLA